MEEASIKGASPPITADQRLGIAIGEMLTGAVQLIGSFGLFGGGAVVSTTGAGAIVGAPAIALSMGLAGTGVLNITSGVQNLIGALNSLSSGGGSGV